MIINASEARGGGSTPTLQTKSKTYTPSLSQQTEQITADAGYDGLQEVDVTVNAISPLELAHTYYPSTSDQTINANRWLSGAQTFKAVTTTNLIASNIKQGVTVEVGDSVDSDRVLSVTGTYTGSSGMNCQGYAGMNYSNQTTLTATNTKLTVAKTGTYTVSWMGFRTRNSGTWQTQLYINSTAYGTAQTTFTQTYGQQVTLTGVSLTQNDVVTVYARASGTSYRMYVGQLIIQQTA